MLSGPSTTVLFDWNGTVVLDTDRAHDALNDVLTCRGLPTLDTAAFRREFHLPMADMFRRLGVEDTASAEIDWNTSIAAAPTLARDGAAALHRLRADGMRLGVVSAASEAAVRSDMAALRLGGLWDSVDAPASDKLEVLRARRGAERAAYYVGDTVYDMRCAVAAGFIPLAVDRGYTDAAALVDAGARAVLSSFDELPEVIRDILTPQR
ncbi:HAD family hydrolase [Microbacterium oxydans]|uniref:HAD family hydrolase n=1 Tax=Microbacterium oxydans TaxID=82380 RepID=UPI00226B7B1B|nr:HAD hydrolase-like protein [Microbacterium oxydans]WAA67519.1 HAD hydrolase-like protein [Microbacterium oxydans]